MTIVNSNSHIVIWVCAGANPKLLKSVQGTTKFEIGNVIESQVKFWFGEGNVNNANAKPIIRRIQFWTCVAHENTGHMKL